MNGQPATKIAYENWDPGDFTVPAISDGYGSIQVVYYMVNDAGQPVNSSGEVQPGVSTAYVIDTFFYEDGGDSALIIPDTYVVVTDNTASDGTGQTYTAYVSGDSKTVSLTTSDPTKTVHFGFTKDLYTVTWKNGTTELEKDENVAYGTAPNYSDDGTPAPTKTAAGQYTYTFDGWSTNPNATSGVDEASLPTVTGDVTYYAIFTETLIKFTVVEQWCSRRRRKCRSWLFQRHL